MTLREWARAGLTLVLGSGFRVQGWREAIGLRRSAVGFRPTRCTFCYPAECTLQWASAASSQARSPHSTQSGRCGITRMHADGCGSLHVRARKLFITAGAGRMAVGDGCRHGGTLTPIDMDDDPKDRKDQRDAREPTVAGPATGVRAVGVGGVRRYVGTSNRGSGLRNSTSFPRLYSTCFSVIHGHAGEKISGSFEPRMDGKGTKGPRRGGTGDQGGRGSIYSRAGRSLRRWTTRWGKGISMPAWRRPRSIAKFRSLRKRRGLRLIASVQTASSKFSELSPKESK